MSEDNKVETPENPIENSTVDVQNENSTTPATTEDQNEKVPKKKYALLMGYLGTEYQGLQINKNCKTIEAEILRALHDAKLVSDLNYNDEYCTTKIQYMRAARTDKGVHAAGNCAHVKLLIKPNGEEEACEEVNRHLPSDIRLFKIQRVTRGFQAKNNCDKRRYEYIMPLECLKPKENKNLPSIEEELIQTWTNYKEYIEEKEKGNTIAIMSKGKEESDKKDIYDQLSLEKACSLVNYIKTYHYTEDEQDKLLGGCVPYDQCPEGSQGMVDRLRAALYLFKGSHRFHNYTVGKNSIDPRSLRTMYGFLCSDPVRIQDHLYLRLCVEGQSFMLNQIRKMVGAAIEVARGSMTLFHLFETMGKGMGISHLSMEVGTVSLPIAPSTGLFLDYCIYDLYNQKPEVQNKLDFTEPSVLQKRNEYKKNAIYPHIDDEIVKNHVFQNWLDELDRNYNGYPITPIEINNIPAMEESTKNKMDKIKQKKMESIARRKRDNDNNDKYSIENAKKRQRMEAKENM